MTTKRRRKPFARIVAETFPTVTGQFHVESAGEVRAAPVVVRRREHMARLAHGRRRPCRHVDAHTQLPPNRFSRLLKGQTVTIDQATVTDPDVPGLSYVVRIVEDTDSTPFDADCYSVEDIQAWRDDAWRYVGVIVTPMLMGIEFDQASTDLWGVEYGSGGEGSFDIGTEDIVNSHPVPDMIIEAREQLAAFAPVLAKVSAAVTKLATEAAA